MIARRAATVAVRAALAAVVLVYVFRRVGLGPVFASLGGARLWPVLGAFLLALLAQAAVALRLGLLTRAQGISLRPAEILEINLTSQFYGLALPGGSVSGLAVRFYRLARGERRYEATLVSLLCDRLLGTLALGAIGLAFWAVDRTVPPRSALAMLLAGTAVSVLLSFVLLAPSAQHVLARAIPRGRYPALDAARGRGREAFGTLLRTGPRDVAGLTLLSLAAHGFGIAGYALLSGALGLELSVVTIGWFRSALTFVSMLPITVSGLGIREGTALLLLVGYGVTESDAVALSLLVFAAMTAAVGLVGGILEAGRWLRPRN